MRRGQAVRRYRRAPGDGRRVQQSVAGRPSSCLVLSHPFCRRPAARPDKHRTTVCLRTLQGGRNWSSGDCVGAAPGFQGRLRAKMAGAVVFFRNLPPHPKVLRDPDPLGHPWFRLQSSPRRPLHLHPDLRFCGLSHLGQSMLCQSMLCHNRLRTCEVSPGPFLGKPPGP